MQLLGYEAYKNDYKTNNESCKQNMFAFYLW